MGRVVVGRGPAPRPASRRRRDLREALVASGAIPNFDYDLAQGSLVDRRFKEAVLAAGFTEMTSDRWPCEAPLGDVAGVVFRDADDAVLASDGLVVVVSVSHGWLRMQAASSDRGKAEGACAAFRRSHPASYLVEPSEGNRVPITFWSLAKWGPNPRLRKIDSAAWADVAGNYTAPVAAALAGLMGWPQPPGTGQLILWQGPPGTGKSWALRALASAWAPWAEFHFITDPDAFFVGEYAASYMTDVLLADSYDQVESSSGDIYAEQDPLGKWRVLILEDTGELLAADAKENYAQGLARLLNVVDGMIGQGLRVLALVTTNDELGDLHPATTRPGRCASQVTFGPLTASEASVWLGYETEAGGTLAELYARGRGQQDAIPAAFKEPDGQRDAPYEALLALAREPLDGSDG